MRTALFVLALFAPRIAHAELWASTAGDLMHDASRIEIIDVSQVKDQTVEGVILESIRSPHATGEKIHIDLAWMQPVPAKGDHVLVVCDPYVCPRAMGIERDGAFRLIAQQPMDGAFVNPNIVEHSAIALLAAGKPAPDLCIRGIVELLDETARPTFELHVRASDGKGKGKLGGRDVDASLGVVWFASEEGTVGLELVGKAQLGLAAATLGRDKTGCYSGSFLPSQPLARTRADLDRALDGKPRSATIGTAALVVPPGAPVPAGRHALVLSVTSDGYLELTSDLAEGRVSRLAYNASSFAVGFPTKGGSPNDPELDLELSVPTIHGYEHGAAVAKALRQGATVTASWTAHGKTTSLGPVAFTYMSAGQH
jgi:hypothetical protein